VATNWFTVRKGLSSIHLYVRPRHTLADSLLSIIPQLCVVLGRRQMKANDDHTHPSTTHTHTRVHWRHNYIIIITIITIVRCRSNRPAASESRIFARGVVESKLHFWGLTLQSSFVS